MTVGCFRDEYPRIEHCKNSRFSYLKTVPDEWSSQVDLSSVSSYNGGSKSQSFRIAVKAPESPLEPLMQGRSVQLLMTVPQRPGARKTIAKPQPIPVVIVPGTLIGSNREVLLVAVIGKGSAVIAPRIERSTAKLVMAGMPSRLAQSLMDEFRRLFWRY